jgi:transposase-like protein
MTHQVKTFKRYSISFQQRVVKEIEEDSISISVMQRRYDIRGGETIQRWIRKFGKTHLLNQIIRIETMEEKDRIKQLEEEIKRLKLALADSLLAKDCLEVVIDEANKEYKTDLKKNFGSGQSKNSKKDIK